MLMVSVSVSGFSLLSKFRSSAYRGDIAVSFYVFNFTAGLTRIFGKSLRHEQKRQAKWEGIAKVATERQRHRTLCKSAKRLCRQPTDDVFN